MPELDGIQLVEQLRNYLPRETCMPILVLTGSTDPQIKRRALLAGATDILFKPLDCSELQMRIRNSLMTPPAVSGDSGPKSRLGASRRGAHQQVQKALSDLSDSQRQIVQQERLRAFGEMAGGVCHDFNNALMSIIGYSELLLQDTTLADDRELLRHYLKTMNTAGRDASHVVSRLRDFYRPREESDVFATVDLNDLIEEIVPADQTQVA